MNKKILLTGALFGIFGIILGAFAAHGLEKLVNEEAVASFETGVRYQMYHAFLLLVLGSTSFLSNSYKSVVYYLTVIGILFFSGSIYGLATNSLSSFDFTSIALITPFGGLLFILAWVLMFIGIIKKQVD
jgi:uncharacterized membrane protein YgdD (TMEM256/DUF423 family)